MGLFKNILRKLFLFWRKEQPASEIPQITELKLPPENKDKLPKKPIQQQLFLEHIKESKPAPELKLFIKEDKIKENILGIDFLFDKETLKIFEEEFTNSSEWEISYDNKGCYLARINKHGYLEHFHRWLMIEKVEKFAKKHHLKKSDVIVHHKNHKHTDNRLKNLEVVSRKDHDEHHKKESVYSKWQGSRADFEDWWFSKKYKE
jgi:hypothetical protein